MGNASRQEEESEDEERERMISGGDKRRLPKAVLSSPGTKRKENESLFSKTKNQEAARDPSFLHFFSFLSNLFISLSSL